MLEKAFTKIPDNTNLILHSDQGWQYQHKHYQEIVERERHLAEYVLKRGIVLINVCAENFFSLQRQNYYIYKSLPQLNISYQNFMNT